MNLEDFHRLVSFELRKGDSLDGYIPLWVEQSVSFLERNVSYEVHGRVGGTGAGPRRPDSGLCVGV